MAKKSSVATCAGLGVAAVIALAGSAPPAFAGDFWGRQTQGMQAGALCVPTPIPCEECLYLETYNPSDPANQIPEIKMTSGTLQSGVLYQIVISGTASYWDPWMWISPIGASEPAPMFPSLTGNKTGLVGIDWEYLFGYPDDTFPVALLPMHFAYGLISTDGGSVYSTPTPVTGSYYSASHTYNYVVVGQGQKAAFKRLDEGPSHDNYGRFYICIHRLTACQTRCTSLR